MHGVSTIDHGWESVADHGRGPDADATLVERVRDGDMAAYGTLVERYSRRAFSIAYGVLRHREDAEDVVQEAFIRILDRFHLLQDGKRFRPWFDRVVVNRAISFQRSRAVRATDSLPTDRVDSGSPLPDRVAEQGELRERLLLALASLSDLQSTIVILADVEEFSSTEIGAMLEMPSGTVRYHLHLARKTLRRVLSSEHGTEEAERRR
jgi:RNA polymerase sigma-70 factor, ECF subfamily